MNVIMIYIFCIAACTAVSCAVLGVFMFLRGVSLMSDAISHALILGIVLMFLWIRSLTSPLLTIGAAGAGISVVIITEYILRKTTLKKDTAIGFVFPIFFSIAIILISRYARDIHLDLDMVLLGDLVFAPFSRFYFYDIDCGPQALWSMGISAITVCAVAGIAWRELALTLFDPLYAYCVGRKPAVVYYCIMIVASIVAVGAFNSVGAIVVVALMIIPAASAFCTARSVLGMVMHAVCYALLGVMGGYWMAAWADVSVAGSIATMLGIIFSLVVIGASETGILGRLYTYAHIRTRIALVLLSEYSMHMKDPFSVRNVGSFFGWSTLYAWYIIRCGRRWGYITPTLTGLYTFIKKYYII
jgi:manganese/zinc/iron transport system permease protein